MKFLPLLILINLAALSAIYSSQRSVGRFSARDNLPKIGTVGPAGFLRDALNGKTYPLFDLADESGQRMGIGVLAAPGQFCAAIAAEEAQ